MPTRDSQRHATRDKIYAAAEALFLDGGYEDTSVAAITDRAGVAKGTFFIHFPSKVDLLAAMGNAQLSRALDVVEAADRRDSWPFSRQIDHVFRSLARGVDSAPELMRVVISERALDAPAAAPANARLLALLAELIKNGKRAGELRADVLADRMATYLMGVWTLSLMQWAERGGNFERWLMESVRLGFDGLRPR